MAWNNFVSPRAITSRRRVVAMALMYGLSLTVRFTSAVSEEAEIPPRAAQNINPATATIINDRVAVFKDWPPRSVQPMAFHHDWPLGFGGCRAACEGPMPITSTPPCFSYR